MERQCNLVLDFNLEFELIQIDSYGLLNLLGHYQVPDLKRKRINQKIWGRPKKY